MSDHWLDAMEYAMRPKEPRHLKGWRKVWSWLRSRPLARVRRNLATERRIRERLRADAEFNRRWYAALRGDYAALDDRAFQDAWEDRR